jgi:hypothetical protein
VLLLAGLLRSFSASAVPDLAPLTAQQLVAKVQQTKVQTFSGTIELATNLGIPSLGSLQGTEGVAGFNPADLLSGVHRASIAVDGRDRQRLSMPGSLSEVDVFHNGRDVWTWQSDGSLVTHKVLPAPEAGTADVGKPDAAPEQPALPMKTPEDLAKQFLDRITPSTAVSVDTPAQIAGHDAYELVLAPHAATSTIDHVALAIDATNGFPLQVSVWAKGASKPAIRLGFVKLSYEKPKGSFNFTPPPGSKINTAAFGAVRGEPGPRRSHHIRNSGTTVGVTRPDAGATMVPGKASQTRTVVGQDWTQVVVAGGAPLGNAQLRELRKAATPVSGAFGRGRLLGTDLINVLFLDDGRVVAGFVTPSALEAAVPHA